MDYETYWSIKDAPAYSIDSSTIGLIVAVLGALAWLLGKKLNRRKHGDDRLFVIWGSAIFALPGLGIFIVTKFIYPSTGQAEAEQFLRSPGLGKIEGVISRCSRSYRGRGKAITIERFTVDTVQFVYGDELLGRFNHFTETNNEVITNGRKVRITYSRGAPYGAEFNTILKIEIEKGSVANQP